MTKLLIKNTMEEAKQFLCMDASGNHAVYRFSEKEGDFTFVPRVGVAFDMLGITFDQKQLDDGLIDYEDFIADDASLLFLALGFKDGQVDNVFINAGPLQFKAEENGNPRRILLNQEIDTMASVGVVKVSGYILTDLGHVVLNVEQQPKEDELRVTGFVLKGSRYNPNRRPIEAV